MVTGRQTSAEPLAPLPHSRAPLFLQRKCACGGTPGPSGECEECRKKKLAGSALQPKLKIGAPDDRFEREADRVAERVTSGATTAGSVSVQPVAGSTVHRQTQGKPARPRGSAVPTAVHRSLDSGGRPLPEVTRAHFESRFGHDFSRVRIHTDARANEGAAAINARAFTNGSQIVFGAGQFAPQSTEGQKLLAHELTHVLQQRSGVVQRSGLIQRACKDGETEHTVVSGDILGKIAEDYDTTVQAIKDRNGLESDTILIGQKLCIPGVLTAGSQNAGTQGDTQSDTTTDSDSEKCSITVPSDADTEQLAGVIFAEADASLSKNDERHAIGWSFLNSARHTQGVCDGTLCTSLKENQRKFLCKKDTRDLGNSVLDTIQKGSVAYGAKRWNLVMDSDRIKSSADLCKLDPGEQSAIEKAIEAATDVMDDKNQVPYIRFNQASDKPPSDRMEKAATVGAHTFYSFKKKDSEGRCLI